MACCRLYSDLDREKEEEGKEAENHGNVAVNAESMCCSAEKNGLCIFPREREITNL